ncbi:Myb-like DNA-binding domain containing protein [Tritrichomonas foetus]|uniref:Myb-like DNA-binding domain containing protein n=1 Tax=Tritrichomonas foetus TaxID=1144522 RepID=A0A1J4K1K7_9EUKA|nr:Myb-like DNA-binding domain containing protein [Tritrichomonas foetus]|eukprot:OHT05321.1 Myb-like DNA-binding domain containing protein [Tritrichomonas foetus]
MKKKTPASLSALAPTRARTPTNKCIKKIRWTKEEDELIFSLVKNSDPINWHLIATNFPNKTTQQVTERWEKVLNPELVKGSWTREEDETIINFVKENGCKNWTRLSTLLPGRIGKQCRERWRNHLDPNIIHTMWTSEEDAQLMNLHKQYGNSWVKISSMMPGRSDNAIKNRWNSTLKKMADSDHPLAPANSLENTNRENSNHPLNTNANEEIKKENGNIPTPESSAQLTFVLPFQNLISPEIQKVQNASNETNSQTDTSPRVNQAASVESNRQKFLVLLEREDTNETS